MMDIKQLDKTYVANTYSRFPVQLIEGSGSILKDETGKEYIDLGSGIAVNAFGVADPVWIEAVTRQLSKLPHTSNLYYTEPQVKLAQLLCERTGMKKVFFGNSGAEANECAIKAARKWNSDKYGEGARSTIITLFGSFHGRTLTTLSATGQDSFHHHFGPFTEGFKFCQPNDLEMMAEMVAGDKTVGAIMMEMVLGEGGVMTLDVEFVKGVAELCKRNELLLITDEVQTGNGRTGTLYAYEQFGIMPDVVTTAKGLGGGLPIGCCMLGEAVQDTLGAGSHGSTFGGNPACAAGALSIMERIDGELLSGVKRKHDMIIRSLEGCKGVKSVSGMGLMLGIETERSAAEIVSECMDAGVLVLTAKHKVRLLPALNIPDELLTAALEKLKEVLAK